MRRAAFLVGLVVVFASISGFAEGIDNPTKLPDGYDTPKDSAAKGKLETVSYKSKTTGGTRRRSSS